MTTTPSVTTMPLSRRTVLKGSALGLAGFTLAQTGFLRSMAAQSDEIQNILDFTATTEQFGVTFLGEGLQHNNDGTYDQPWPDDVIAVVRAARAQEQFHLDAFLQAGGTPLVDSFTVPPETLTSFDAFFAAIVEQETAETALHIAAMTVFTELGRPDLAKISFQYAAEEAEHRLLANYTLGARPANDVAFARPLFATPEEFYQSLQDRGIIGGTGTPITFPGPGTIYTDNVIETTPGGVAVMCGGDATPVASPVEATPAATPVS